MITVYMTVHSSSSRKAKTWLKDHQIAFTPRDLILEPITYPEFKQILRLTENGTADLIATRSHAFQQYKGVLQQDLSIRQLFDLVSKEPSLLRQPLIMDERRLQIGYNDVDIRQFIPRRVRQIELMRAQLGLKIA